MSNEGYEGYEGYEGWAMREERKTRGGRKKGEEEKRSMKETTAGQ